MRIAFLGLGIMGKPMAQNLVKAGHELKVWNRSPGKTVDGAHSASTPREAAKDAEIVWLCVSDTKAVGNHSYERSTRLQTKDLCDSGPPDIAGHRTEGIDVSG